MAEINSSAAAELQPPTMMHLDYTFRKTFLWYLKKNSNPKVLLRLMQCSKFFCFTKFPYLIVTDLSFDYDRWGYREFGTDDTRYECYDGEPAWIAESITMYDTEGAEEEEDDRHNITQFIPDIAVLGLKELCLGHQNITLKQFKFLTHGPVFIVSMRETIVKDEGSGDIVPVETLLKCLPSTDEFFYDYSDTTALTITPESTTNIIQALKNSRIKALGLSEIRDTFDFEAFCKFLNVHGKQLEIRRCNLDFHKSISSQYKKKLQNYDIKMIEDTSDKYYPVDLNIPGEEDY